MWQVSVETVRQKHAKTRQNHTNLGGRYNKKYNSKKDTNLEVVHR